MQNRIGIFNKDALFLRNQGGISLNDNKISDVNYVLSDTDFKDGYAILKKGKKVFYKLV